MGPREKGMGGRRGPGVGGHNRRHVGQSAQIEVGSFEAIRALTARAFDFRPLKARLDDADHLVRDSILKVENVREAAV